MSPRWSTPTPTRLEKSGKVDEAIAAWADAVKRHKAILDDPKASQDEKSRNQSGYENASRHLFITRVRQAHRPTQTQPPIDVHVQRPSHPNPPPRFWKSRDSGTLLAPRCTTRPMRTSPTSSARGSLSPARWDGARVDVRLQDQGYKMPESTEFNFDIDPSLTIMQDAAFHPWRQNGEAGRPLCLEQDRGAVRSPRTRPEQAIYSFNPAKTASIPASR